MKWSKGVRNCLAFDTVCNTLKNVFQTREHLDSESGDRRAIMAAQECASRCINQQLWDSEVEMYKVYTDADTYFRGNWPAIQSDLEKGQACFAAF